MPVMHKMRENTHIILFFLLVMFLLSMTIGGLVGGADITHLFGRRPDTILSVNGENISAQYYDQFHKRQYELYRQQNQKDPQGYELQQLEDEIWESLIRDVLLRQAAKKMNVSVTKEEIKYYFENPPAFLRQDPNFQDEQGNFDMKKYQAALNDERNVEYWDNIQAYLEATLPFNKIYQQVLSSVFVTDEEVRQEYIKQNQKVRVKYVTFDVVNFKVEDSAISAKEIEKYYNEHQENYKEEEKRKIQYVMFNLVPSAADTEEVIATAESLIDSLQQGSDFAALAKTYSEDPGSAQNGGDLNYFERGMMTKPFEEAAFAAKVGEVVGPVISQFGVHLIKVEDKKVEDGKEKVKARHILLKFKPSNNTIETARDNANYFLESATEIGFDAAATTEKLKVDTTDFFANTGFIPRLGVQRQMVDAIFHSKIGKLSRVHFIEDRGYIIYELVAIQKARVKPLKDVEAAIRSTLKREKQKALAEQAAQQFRQKIQNPEDFELIAQQNSLNIVETEPFALTGFVRNFGREPKFNGAAFRLNVGEVSPVISGTRGAFVLKVIEKMPIDETDFLSKKENLTRELYEKKQQAVYKDWYENLKETAKIRDYRYLFY